jgi:integrase
MAIYKLSSAKIAAAIKAARTHPQGRIQRGDGGGLWLIVSDHGENQSWIFRYTHPITRKECRMGLGALHTIDLDRARELAKANRILLDDHKDPMAVRDERRTDAEIAAGLARTVSQVADEYWKAKLELAPFNTRKGAFRVIRDFAHRPIGDMPIQKVDRNTILKRTGLEDAWVNMHDTAVAALTHLRGIFELAKDSGYYVGVNPVLWSGLKSSLPKKHLVHSTKHNEALPFRETGRFLERWRAYRVRGIGGRGRIDTRTNISLIIEFIILTGARGCEVWRATWSEFDEINMIWTVPRPHLKKRKGPPLQRPITKPMLAVLEEMRKRCADHSPDALAFPGAEGAEINQT